MVSNAVGIIHKNGSYSGERREKEKSVVSGLRRTRRNINIKIMTKALYLIAFQLLCVVVTVTGWKAVPASQAMYALRGGNAHYGPGTHYGPTEGLIDDEALPRNYIHSIYKFGWCTPDTIQRVFLRKRANITLSDWQSTQATYIYLLDDGGTIRFSLQCIVMKTYVPRKHMFRRSRLPLYYCQGDLFFVWKLTYQRIDLHEFYLQNKLNIPANFVFEFYHATPQ